jgi:hypothetical protein
MLMALLLPTGMLTVTPVPNLPVLVLVTKDVPSIIHANIVLVRKIRPVKPMVAALVVMQVIVLVVVIVVVVAPTVPAALQVLIAVIPAAPLVKLPQVIQVIGIAAAVMAVQIVVSAATPPHLEVRCVPAPSIVLMKMVPAILAVPKQ